MQELISSCPFVSFVENPLQKHPMPTTELNLDDVNTVLGTYDPPAHCGVGGQRIWG